MPGISPRGVTVVPMVQLLDSSATNNSDDLSAVGTVAADARRSARRITLNGRVQGLGVRPAIYRLATELGLAGSIRNTSRGVEIELEGLVTAIAQFESTLFPALPTAALVTSIVRQELPLGKRAAFTIAKELCYGPLTTRVPEDRAVCPECLQDVRGTEDRRSMYPLTSCTQCGPRYSVIRTMPYERAETAMRDFNLCAACRREYERPGDRRFLAQTTACPVCGPHVWSTAGSTADHLQGAHALAVVATTLLAGKIVALRGIGGYQLMVDATNASAVERLRARKRRPTKPLAVMVDSLSTAEQLAYFDAAERGAFLSAAAPIVLVKSRPDNGLVRAVAPNLHTVGLMRPTTPLHDILVRKVGRPLVCSSANREGEPLAYEIAGAEERLRGLCDLWLHHSRQIVRPIDDSVVRIIAGRPVTLRLARGLAPFSLDLPAMPPTLAAGGFLKAAVAWSNGIQSVLGSHIGDQTGLAARERYVAQIADWQHLYRFEPACLVHDLHPEYFSTQWAQSQHLPTLEVQHHHAHIVAAMLEHGLLEHKVLGVAWDGTGYGTDGTIWGGEFLLATATGFERFAQLRPFCLPGGETAIYEPWRIAVALAEQLGGATLAVGWLKWKTPAERLAAVRGIVNRPQLSPNTSSAGRLIDAAAAIVLGIERVDYDGEAPMRLEAIADRTATGSYDFPLCEGQPAELDWRPLFQGLLADCRRGVAPGIIAMRFHRSLAEGILRVCRSRTDLPVVLSGGVFQNRLLTELIVELCDPAIQLFLPGMIPPNDGGLAAGQLAIAAMKGH